MTSSPKIFFSSFKNARKQGEERKNTLVTMEPSGVSDEKRPTVDLVKDKNGTDQVLLKNPKGASVKVIDFFVSPMFT